jgi:hypothetical protein
MLRGSTEVTRLSPEYSVSVDGALPTNPDVLHPQSTPGVILETGISYLGADIHIELVLESDTELSQPPQAEVSYGNAFETVSFAPTGSDDRYSASLQINTQTELFDGTGHMDISMIDMTSTHHSFLSYFEIIPLSSTELNRVFMNGLNLNLEGENVSSDQLSVTLATFAVPYAAEAQMLFPVTEMFTLMSQYDSSLPERGGLNIRYDSAEVVGLDETTVGIYRWNRLSSEWQLLNDSRVDLEDNTVSALIDSFGIYTVFAASQSDDTTPPSRIGDLDATGGAGHADVSLTWTSPGDDGFAGQATNYVVRFDEVPITHVNWEESHDVFGEPKPGTVGAAESMHVSMPSANRLYYFAVKTEDEGGNVSEISNYESAISGLLPYTFSLVSPAFGDTIEALLPTLRWESYDSNDLDYYTLWYSEDESFLPKTEISSIMANEFTLQDALENGRMYFWKVSALTIAGETKWCNQSYYRFMTSTATPSTGNCLNNENIYFYPNPFNPDTEIGNIRYSLSEPGDVTIRIYDVSDERVITLISAEPTAAATELSQEWDGRNEREEVVANGVYFYIIESNSGEKGVGKCAVLR